MAILTLDHVTYKYKNAHKAAVSGVSCKFEEGNVYAIVGLYIYWVVSVELP